MKFIHNKKKLETLKKEILNLNKKINDMDREIASDMLREDKKPPHY